MNPDNIDRIRTMHRAYYHSSIDSLPDGWTQLVMDFLHVVDGIGDLTDSVSIRFERCPDGCRAFAFPEMSRWHPEQMHALRVAQRELYGLSQQTCEVCGNPGAIEDEDGHTYCIGHTGVDPARARAEALYQELRDLFPPVRGKVIDLNVPDHLFELLASSLRSILKLVIREGVVGKVLITRVEVDDDALFVRVRYQNLTAVHLGIQMAVNEMVADLEALSDEATRKHQHGGSDAAS
ncbi:hypothetical protein G6K88_13890 [Agrobacterium rhizogenes]|uniref:hypothetical protein n=1 Tax=Rhizobium rhizogenes TaxID=359 RepID=UPI00115F2468|nr:hypothetical protein [Rhizobium rhizogenes]NTI03111.1 hypothetical protein [Rhizobium rhizogenes]NTI09915.1 hypothetical protein [Rhizobium rhizogenes]TRB20260.1 hypothetical protein EXN70_26375 [Rhizobium rhizogenes]